MKKTLSVVLFFLCVLLASNAQFTTGNIYVKASQMGETLINIDEVLIIDSIYSTSTITYTHSSLTNFKWYRYLISPATKIDLGNDESNTFSTTLNFNTPSAGYFGNGDNCGYVLEYEDGFEKKYKYIWVLDRMNNNIRINNLTADTIGVNPCSSTHLIANVSPLSFTSVYEYWDSLGVRNTIDRRFIIRYNSLDSLNKSVQKEIEKFNIISGDNNFIVPSPYITTKFTLEGDQFFRELGHLRSFSSVDFTPYAVQQNLKGVVSERSERNEIDRSKGILGGSAPLVVDLTSNANKPITQNYEWNIISKKDSTDRVFYTDENLRYKFNDDGLYKIILEVSNSRCASIDSIEATVLASQLEVPNVFTPNGDGSNDEFRVAYRSLITFKGIIFNRWGRKVFEWSDPQKGWDGRIGNKIAQPGAYYYIIEAVGSDIDPRTNKPVLHIKRGDINLIRGK